MNFQSYHRPLFPWVDYTHFHSVNSDHSYLAMSCTCIDCPLGNTSRYVQELGVIVEHGNRSNTRMDTVTLCGHTVYSITGYQVRWNGRLVDGSSGCGLIVGCYCIFLLVFRCARTKIKKIKKNSSWIEQPSVSMQCAVFVLVTWLPMWK
jgi:hypothetical protein